MKNMTTTEKLGRYETAQETLGMMVAMRSRWIHEERQKQYPDTEKIALWKNEITQFSDEDDTLSMTRMDEVERVLATYCPIVKAHFAQP
jgi:hypothetical protein